MKIFYLGFLFMLIGCASIPKKNQYDGDLVCSSITMSCDKLSANQLVRGDSLCIYFDWSKVYYDKWYDRCISAEFVRFEQDSLVITGRQINSSAQRFLNRIAPWTWSLSGENIIELYKVDRIRDQKEQKAK